MPNASVAAVFIIFSFCIFAALFAHDWSLRVVVSVIGVVERLDISHVSLLLLWLPLSGLGHGRDSSGRRERGHTRGGPDDVYTPRADAFLAP